MNPVRWPSNNPDLTHAGLAANRRRSRRTAQRHSAAARQALDALATRIEPNHPWRAVLAHRAGNPTASLRELADTMTPPMTKHAYASHLRRALRLAQFTSDDVRHLMTHDNTNTNDALREALLNLLAPGRAITTAELRTHLADDHGFTGLTNEAVYRQLAAMARRGQVHRLRHPSRRHIYWSTQRTTPPAQLGQERQ